LAKERVRCTVCGAKNELVDHCRICATLLPGADKRRREGSGGKDFSTTVEEERAAWKDYREGRMSAAARSRRPRSLPDAPPSTWGSASALLDESPDSEPLPPHAQFAPQPHVVERPAQRSGPTVRGVITVLLALAIAVAVGFGAWYLLVRDDAPAPPSSRPAPVVVTVS
jgi:hypothetical protein